MTDQLWILFQSYYSQFLTLEYHFNEASDSPYIHLLSFQRYPSGIFDSGGGITNNSLSICSPCKKAVLISIVCNSQSFWIVSPNITRKVSLEHLGDSFSLLL